MTSIYAPLNAALYSTLSGGTALTALLGGTAIYYLQAPDHAELPYVVWSYQGGGQENINPSDLHDPLVYVRGYSSASPAAASAIDAAVDALLDRQTLAVTGYSNFWTRRESLVPPMVETPPNGAKVYSAGALYRIRLSK
jgi:hypothetical protein